MTDGTMLDLTGHWAGYAALATCAVAYALVIGEEQLHLRKSKPMMVAAGLVWLLVAVAYRQAGDEQAVLAAVRHNLLEYAELFLFLLAAMTYVNTIQERGVFERLRIWLVSRNLTYRALFWVTGGLAFVLSPIADNLTTALVMGTVVMTVGAAEIGFVTLACVNVVVAANAGGAFSPFGDITTLMVWQKGLVDFSQFFALALPSLVNWLVPALLMTFAVPQGRPAPSEAHAEVLPGGWATVVLFLLTIALAVSFHAFLHLPPALGMMTGLGLLKLYAYGLVRWWGPGTRYPLDEPHEHFARSTYDGNGGPEPFDPFEHLERAEWDTLLFFYGVMLAVGGLGALGYLGLASGALFGGLGATWANVLVGFLSALVDNIPVMFAVLSMDLQLPLGQWLLLTLTAGVGGSLLAVGSAAGVALLGQAHGVYTFFGHLRWSWAIALGYAASILAHLWLNRGLF
jgi:Na+/H+ antiporter NhaD/arsenite permease-like protein